MAKQHVEHALKAEPAEQLSVMLADDAVYIQGYNIVHQQSVKQGATLQRQLTMQPSKPKAQNFLCEILHVVINLQHALVQQSIA